jgi:hypothetical protein
MAPEVLDDPIGVIVNLVANVEPSLDRAVIAEVAAGVTGGRAKRRRLAQALLDKPVVLADGSSPAPRVVADLLIALRKAGATRISPPVCTDCGKQLRTFQRRGEHWYCAVCGPRREPCAACGQVRPINMRDRDGRPRCAKCSPDDGRDPVDTVVDLVMGVDPTLSADAVIAALTAAAPRTGQRHQLSWALADRPDLLTGAGAQAPVPSVLRLIDNLCDAGAKTITHPACPGCQRVIHLHRPINGTWLCRNCTAKSRAQPCSRCGAVREAATRDEDGRPLCPHCLITDPANHETCVECRRRLPVSIRTPDGPLCQNCRPLPTLICSICQRSAPCETSMVTGQPWCKACQQWWARCATCGEMRPVRAGSRDEPLCGTCARPEASFWRACPTCGEQNRIRGNRPCVRCALRQRLRDLLRDQTGTIRPELRALYDNLADDERPTTVLSWLDLSRATDILRELGAGSRPVSHATLDDLPDGNPVEHLRSMLVCLGTLPPRDEQMIRLDRWVTRIIDERTDPDQQQILRRYGVWHLLRRLRRRVEGTETTHNQLATARQHLRGAIALLDWLDAHGLTLTTWQQPDLDRWLTDDNATHRREAGHFVRWANKQKLTHLNYPAVKWGGPTRVIDTETRWNQARWLLHDHTVKPEDRVAGLLVLLYAQWPSAISRLTLKHIEHHDNQVRLRLGHEPIVLPDPLAALVLQLVDTRRGKAALGDSGASPWLFPGGQPGRPISAFGLGDRLRQLGLHPGQARSTALFQLATDLPAAMLAEMLGIHITVAVAWQRASSGDWTNYAAEVSRRGSPRAAFTGSIADARDR